MIRNGWYIKINATSYRKDLLCGVKDSPCVDCKRGFSKERESVYTVWSVPAEQRVYYIWVRHWEESRPSSWISGLLSCYHILIGRWWRTHWRMCKRPGVVIGFGSEGWESETSVRKERSYLCYCSNFNCMYYVTDD